MLRVGAEGLDGGGGGIQVLLSHLIVDHASL